jgi:hypothetical protein
MVEVDSVSTRADGAESEPHTQQQPTPVPKTVGRPRPIIVTASINFLKFQGKFKPLMKNTFEFRTTRNGIKMVRKDMADYSALMSHLNASKIPYYTFHPKSPKPVKAVIRQLPGDTPAEDISNELVALSYFVISARQMTVT